MEIQLVRGLHKFSALREEWDELLSRSSADTIFLTWEWLYSWWESYAGAENDLYIVTVRENTGTLIGILPLYRQVHRWLPLKTVKTLRFIGDGSWDSDYLDAILLQGREKEILDELWKWLCSQRSSWDMLQFDGIPETSPTYRWLDRTADERDVVSRRENLPCLVIDLPEKWEEYLALLKPRFRTKVRSTLRDTTAGHDFRFRSVGTEADLEASLQTLYDLHGKRWESKGTDGVFRNPAKRRFYERFTPRFLARGWLAFDILELNGSAVACQMCFRYRGAQFLLQEGFDPQFASESVGIALRAMVLKKAIEDGIRQYDFLAGEGRHKAQWQPRLKHCHTVSFAPRTVLNTLYLRLPALMEAWRDRVKMKLPAKVLEMRRRFAAS